MISQLTSRLQKESERRVDQLISLVEDRLASVKNSRREEDTHYK
jgi:hypothetical protein